MKKRSSLSWPKTMTPRTNDRRRPKKRTHNPPLLPTLTHPDNGETVVAVKVLAQPVAGEKGCWVWVVEEPPSRRLGYGQLVSIQSSNGESGPGLLTSITDLRQHWITWEVAGGPADRTEEEPADGSKANPTKSRTKIRIPTPWTSLSGVEAVAHARHYHALPQSPAPHHNAQPPPRNANEQQSPYDYDLREDEKKSLESRLDTITRKKWQWKPEGERRRRNKPERKPAESPM